MMRFSIHNALRLLSVSMLLMALFACSSTKYVGEDELLLSKVKVTTDNKLINTSELALYSRQHPNTKWLSTFKVPLALYNLSGHSNSWGNRMLRKMGEAPVILNDSMTSRTEETLRDVMFGRGYLDTKVTSKVTRKRKHATVTYNITTGEPYILRKVGYNIQDDSISQVLRREFKPAMHSGQVFSLEALNNERKQITSILHENGYYLFNKEFITYDVDTSQVTRAVNLTLNLNQFRANNLSPLTDHPSYRIGKIKYDIPAEGRVKLRRKIVEKNTAIKTGELYKASDLQQTYNNFARLQAVKYTSIHFTEIPDSNLLDCHILLSRQNVNTIEFQPEGTNTAGDFGAAASLTYRNRNMFRGSELFSITGRVAYEAISNLDGYQEKNYLEYGVESSLQFPRYLVPFIPSRKFKVQNATSELSVSYNLQNRPEFHRRISNIAWRYKWSNLKRHTQYKLDLIEFNYLWMPWISPTFKKDYIDSGTNRNAILRYNYEDLLIMKLGFSYTWSNKGSSLRLGAETSGNILNALSRPFRFSQNADGNYKFISIAYAQYAKLDFDYTKMVKMDDRNSLYLHSRVGVGYPYGNSTILPFEKRYFAGGPNSLRGWSVRGLGPGTYRGKDGRIDFINQTGDIKLDLNAELRSTLFWKLQGAVFIDAGNIWTIREYEEQPGGAFHFETFWKQLAANYGLGLRVNLDYFVVRFDMGMKAVNPAYEDAQLHFPVIHPKLSRDFAFHFAVGMPF